MKQKWYKKKRFYIIILVCLLCALVVRHNFGGLRLKLDDSSVEYTMLLEEDKDYMQVAYQDKVYRPFQTVTSDMFGDKVLGYMYDTYDVNDMSEENYLYVVSVRGQDSDDWIIVTFEGEHHPTLYKEIHVKNIPKDFKMDSDYKYMWE